LVLPAEHIKQLFRQQVFHSHKADACMKVSQLLTGTDFWLWFMIPVVMAVAISLWLSRIWRRYLAGIAPIPYKTETFRNPINLSITVIAFIVPLVLAFLAYILKESQTQSQDMAGPLFASLLVLLLALLIGLFLVYSYATVSPKDDSFEISQDKNYLLPAVFAAQLSLLFFGIAMITGILLFRLEVPYATDQFKTSSKASAVAGLPFQLGTSEQQVRALWGCPDRIAEKANGSLRYTYASAGSAFILTFRKGKLISQENRLNLKQEND
jgi:hypothetical protein